jgi:hypothetical protein
MLVRGKGVSASAPFACVRLQDAATVPQRAALAKTSGLWHCYLALTCSTIVALAASRCSIRKAPHAAPFADMNMINRCLEWQLLCGEVRRRTCDSIISVLVNTVHIMLRKALIINHVRTMQYPRHRIDLKES